MLEFVDIINRCDIVIKYNWLPFCIRVHFSNHPMPRKRASPSSVSIKYKSSVSDLEVREIKFLKSVLLQYLWGERDGLYAIYAERIWCFFTRNRSINIIKKINTFYLGIKILICIIIRDACPIAYHQFFRFHCLSSFITLVLQFPQIVI